MKRIFACLLICLLCISLALPCLAFANPPVIDGAEYLTESELSALTAKLEGIRQAYSFEVAIVTEEDLSGYSAMESADDIYDYNGYGAGENDDGILLYICSGTREYHITTHADGLRVFNQNGIAYLQKNIEPYLAADDYYTAMDTFATLADELLAMAESGEPFNKRQLSTSYLLTVILAALLIPLLIAFLKTKSKLSKMKTAVANDYAANYMKPGSRQITASRDMFLYSNVVRTEKPKNNSGSHTSSSGRTHGGGGGSF